MHPCLCPYAWSVKREPESPQDTSSRPAWHVLVVDCSQVLGEAGEQRIPAHDHRACRDWIGRSVALTYGFTEVSRVGMGRSMGEWGGPLLVWHLSELFRLFHRRFRTAR